MYHNDGLKTWAGWMFFVYLYAAIALWIADAKVITVYVNLGFSAVFLALFAYRAVRG